MPKGLVNYFHMCIIQLPSHNNGNSNNSSSNNNGGMS